MFEKVSENVKQQILNIAGLYKSLKYIKSDKVHPCIRIPLSSLREVTRYSVKVKLLSVAYILQSTRAAFNQNEINPTCLLCTNGVEDLLLTCVALEAVRTPILNDL